MYLAKTKANVAKVKMQVKLAKAKEKAKTQAKIDQSYEAQYLHCESKRNMPL